ncbi:complex exonuclease RRP46 homolog [Seminavis robusta]|uniref:Complex exonuclease RRP46 homolog n=1 Tax=Seminavis robusta TaxID=568900 RepID=A0A9N8D794_9STRA|nr:complex exonuclease RRP46 homolog [Seminavis robusta]|eukprot:Sro6_g005010.1 complex exonuclease RRP46 homolog (158) ;mRNA; r:73924-74397
MGDGRLLLNGDGGACTTLRPLSCELSCLQRADGSSLWKSGSTQVMAAVYGPIAPRIPSQEKGDEAQVSVVIKSGRHNNANNNSKSNNSMLEREWEQLVTSIFTACIDTNAYARTVVEVVLQVVQDDGSVLAAALHAAVAALMDAGVSLTNLPVATTF